MNLKEVILNCNKYIDTDDMMHGVFAVRHDNVWQPDSEAVVLELTLEEMEMDLKDIAQSKCPGFEYFLEIFILKEFFGDLKNLNEYRSDDEKVKRVIYYAEFDA